MEENDVCAAGSRLRSSRNVGRGCAKEAYDVEEKRREMRTVTSEREKEKITKQTSTREQIFGRRGDAGTQKGQSPERERAPYNYDDGARACEIKKERGRADDRGSGKKREGGKGAMWEGRNGGPESGQERQLPRSGKTQIEESAFAEGFGHQNERPSRVGNGSMYEL